MLHIANILLACVLLSFGEVQPRPQIEIDPMEVIGVSHSQPSPSATLNVGNEQSNPLQHVSIEQSNLENLDTCGKHGDPCVSDSQCCANIKCHRYTNRCQVQISEEELMAQSEYLFNSIQRATIPTEF